MYVCYVCLCVHLDECVCLCVYVRMYDGYVCVHVGDGGGVRKIKPSCRLFLSHGFPPVLTYLPLSTSLG